MNRFHALFGRHKADLKGSRWDEGRFITECLICGCEMVKPPNREWQVATKA